MQDFLRTAALVLFVLSVVTWSAGQTSAAQSTPGATNPQAASPNPTANPAQGDAQGLATPNSQMVQTPATGQSLSDELQLTPDQQSKISSVLEEENRRIAAVRNDQTLSNKEKTKRIQDIRQADAPKIKAVLTPEQEEKLTAIQERVGPPPTAGQQPDIQKK